MLGDPGGDALAPLPRRRAPAQDLHRRVPTEEELDDALASRARRTHTSKAALTRDAVRRSIGEPEPPVDPFREWIGGSDAESAPVDDVVYGS
jgi:hypothetical protein